MHDRVHNKLPMIFFSFLIKETTKFGKLSSPPRWSASGRHLSILAWDGHTMLVQGMIQFCILMQLGWDWSQVVITAVVSSLSSAKLPGSQRLQSEKFFYVKKIPSVLWWPELASEENFRQVFRTSNLYRHPAVCAHLQLLSTKNWREGVYHTKSINIWTETQSLKVTDNMPYGKSPLPP